MNSRKGVRCADCNSLERTRPVRVVLHALDRPKRGDRILHFAPERGLAQLFKTISPEGYEPADFNPAIYPDASSRRFDLTTDCASLEADSYDLILHLHVLEHIPINIAYVLHHLHRALKPTGLHIFCVPIVDAPYDEYFGSLSHEDALRRFGQNDHVRLFGEKDVHRHLGAILRLKGTYSLRDYADDATLARFNIPEALRSGLNSNTIFVMQKNDYLLWP
jgi:phosphoglycolate phosphatase